MRRPIVLGIGIVLVFAVTVGILWQVMPQPRKEIDYLIMGGAATMVSLVALFLALISTIYKGEDIFFKRRK